jgi:hypothetical protein
MRDVTLALKIEDSQTNFDINFEKKKQALFAASFLFQA